MPYVHRILINQLPVQPASVSKHGRDGDARDGRFTTRVGDREYRDAVSNRCEGRS